MINIFERARTPLRVIIREKAGLVAVGTTLLITGCASTKSIIDQITSKDYDEMYLRGVFTWWEADENYKLVKLDGSNIYYSSAELVADGQPYDFKFADENWSPGYRCGYLIKDEDEVVTEGVRVKVNCDTPVDNFKFTPPTTGIYNFYIDFTVPELPEVYVKKQ